MTGLLIYLFVFNGFYKKCIAAIMVLAKKQNNLSRDVGNAKKQCAYRPIQNFEEIHGGKG